MATVSGIQNPKFDFADGGTAAAAAAAQATADGAVADIATLDGRVTDLEALTAPSYGSIYENNETGTNISLTANTSFYQWVSGSAGDVSGAPYVTVGSSQITIGASGAGLYLINCHYSGTLGAANELRAAIFKGSSEQGHLRIDQDISTLAKYQAGAISGFLRLVEGDVISLRFGSDTNTQTFTIKHANLSLHRIDL